MAQSSSKAKSQAGIRSWVGNAMRSVGKSGVDTFKKIAPNISSAGTGMYEGGKKVRSSLRPSNLVGISRDLTKNKYVRIAKKALDQSVKDIKSGNLYNADRSGEAYLGGGFDDDFDFDGFGENDYSEDSGGDNFFIHNSTDTGETAAATFAMTSAIAKNSETTVAVGNAMVDTMMGMSSAMISEVQAGFGEVSSKLASVNDTLTAILSFHNENTTKFYESMLTKVSAITPPAEEESSYYGGDDNPMAVFGSKGGISLSSYKDYIKKRMKKVVEDSPAGMVMGMLDDNTIEMLFADPVGGITNTIVSAMIPNVVERTLKTVDKTVGQLEQNVLLDIGKWATDSSKGFIQQMIGSVFGLHPDQVKRNVAMSSITKDAAVFDNITRNSIVEVLPKYARESTAYLREIAMHVTKKDSNALLSGSEVFDAQNNRYVRQDKLMENFLQDMSQNLTSTFKSSAFGEAINSISGNLSEKDATSFNKAYDQFIAKLATSDRNFTYRDFNVDDKNSPVYALLKGTGSKRDRQLLREAIKYMYENGQAANAAKAQQDARTAWNNQIKDYSENYDTYNLHALGIDNSTDMVDMLIKYQNGQIDKETLKQKVKGGKIKNSMGKRVRIGDLVTESIDGYTAGEEMFGDNKVSGGQLSSKILGENFGQGFKQMGNRAVNSMRAIMRGDSQGALTEFGKIFTDQMKNMWNGAKEHFIKPLSEKLYGKDENGNAIGLFAGTRKKLSDTYAAILQKINGKDYTDSAGEVHKAEPGTSLVDRAADVFKNVKTGVMTALFGDKAKLDESGDPIEGSQKKGVFSKLTDSMKAGIQGWKEAVFGESENPEEEVENLKKKALDHLPSAALGTAGGAFVGAAAGGSLMGTLIGGPVGGAVLGFASSFLFKSDKFKDYIFGPEVEDENGKRRIGGLISEKTQKMFKENKNSLIGGAALGALKSMIFPGAGLMTSIVGGPIAGAAIGAGVGMLKKSEAFQKFLYGDEENGKKGVVTAFKEMFKKKDGSDNPEVDKENAKALGMGAIGAAGGAVTASLIGKVGILGAMATPAGPLGGAIVGAAMGIAAGGRKFREFLFGKKDPETNKRKGGLFQKFGNFLHVEILAPMKSKIQEKIDDAMITFKYDVLETIRLPFTMMAGKISEKIGNVKDFISEKVGGAIKSGFEFVTKKFAAPFMKYIFDPARKILGKATDIVYNFAKSTILAPFRLVRAVGKAVTSKIGKGIRKVTGYALKLTGGVFKYTTKAIGMAIGLVTAPFRKGFKKIGEFVQNRKDAAAQKYSGGGGGIKGALYRAAAGLTSSEWRRGDYTNQADKAEAKAKAKADARKRAIQDHNRRMIARELGYDVKYFTEKNMNDAIEHAKATKNKKFRLRGMGPGQNISDFFEYDPEERARQIEADRQKALDGKSTAEIAKDGDKSPDISIRQLSEQHRTNEILEEMLRRQRRDRGSSPIDDLDDEYEGSDEELQKIKEQYKEFARQNGFNFDPETGRFEPIEDSNGSHDENRGGNNQDEPAPKRSFKDWMRGVSEAGGIGKYFANSIKEGYQGSWLQQSVGKVRGLFGSNSDEIIDEAEREGHTRAAGGPINEGEPYIVGEGGRDTSGAELIVPNQSGHVLSPRNDGIHVYVKDFDSVSLGRLKDVISDKNEGQESVLNQVLSVIEDFGEDIPVLGHAISRLAGIANQNLRGSDFNNEVNESGFLSAIRSRLPFGGHRATGGAVSKGAAYLVGDGGNDPQAKEIFVPRTSGSILAQGVNGIKVVLAGITKQAAKDFKSVEVGGSSEKSGSVLDEVKKGNTYVELKKKAAELKEQESDNKREEMILDTLKEIRDKNTEHHSIWNSIFSKKGILTLGAIALGTVVLTNLPKIVDTIKGFGSIFQKVADGIDWFFKNKTGEDGKNSLELLADEAGQMKGAGTSLLSGDIPGAASNFILDNGRYDANSGGRAAFLTNIVRKPLRTAIKVGSSVVKGGTAIAKGTGSLVAKGAQKLAYSSLGRTVVGALPQGVQATLHNAGRKMYANQIEKTISKGLTAKLAAGVAQDGTEALAKSSKGLLPKVTSLLDDFIKGVLKKLGIKMPAMLSKVMGKVGNVLKKFFGKIAAKISAALGIKGGAEAATFGLSTAVFVTCGAINGLTGAARLFKVDKSDVDGTMTLISSIMGGITVGTVTGSIIDIVSGLIFEVLNFDLLGTIAMCLYQALTGKEKGDALVAAQKEWEATYLTERDEKLQKEFEVQKAAGIVGADVDFDQFKQGVLEDGTYSARIDSYQDWNADKNKTIGYRIGSGFTKGWQATKKWWKGSDRYTDDKGQQYIDNGDGTVTVIGADGKELGKMSSDAVDLSNMQNDHKKGAWDYVKGAGKTAANGIKSAAKGLGKIGAGVVDGFKTSVKGVVDLGKNVVTGIGGIMKGAAKIKENFDNPNMSTLDYFKADVNPVPESNQIYPIANASLNAMKYVGFPVMMIAGITKKVGDGITNKVKGTVSTIANTVGAVFKSNIQLHVLAAKGDTSGILHYDTGLAEDTPLKGFIDGVVLGQKLVTIPESFIAGAGIKMAKSAKEAANKVRKVTQAWHAEQDKLDEIAKNGDFAALDAYEPTVPEDTPVSGFVGGALKVSKYVHYISTGIGWASNKVNDATTKVKDTVTGAFNKAKDTVASMGKKLKDNFTLGKDAIKNYAAKLMEYSDPEKDKKEMDKLKIGNGQSLIGNIVSTIVRSVVEPIVTVKRSLGSIGKWINDKFGNVSDWIMGIFDKGKDIANGKYDDAIVGGNGVGRRNFGGRGPESVNGAAYFSQNDPRWSNAPYVQGANDGATIGDTGCAPASMAMVAKQLGAGNANPVNMANMASAGGYRDQTGTNQKYVDYAANKMGMEHSSTYNPSAAYIQSQAAQGNPVMLNGISAGEPGSAYTDAGHYVVAVGTDSSGNVIVNDPRGQEYSKAYDPRYLASETRKAWSFRKGGRGPRKIASGLSDTLIDVPSNNSATQSSNVKFAPELNMMKVGVENMASVVKSSSTSTSAQTFDNPLPSASTLTPGMTSAFTSAVGMGVNALQHGIEGTTGDWISIVRAVKALMAEQQPIYWTDSGSRMHTIVYNGESYSVRPDCSGIIAAMLQIYGALPKGKTTTSAELHRDGAIPKGFTKMPFPGWGGLNEGDIIVKGGHVEIFANNNGGKHYVYNGGSTKSLRSAGPTISGGGNYTVMWRPNIAGNGSMFSGTTGGAVLGSNSGYSYDSSGSSYGGAVASSGSTGGNSFMDKLSRIGSVLTNAAGKALQGVFTGNWDYNLSDSSGASSGGDTGANYSNGSSYESAGSSYTGATSTGTGQTPNLPATGFASAVNMGVNALNRAINGSSISLTGNTDREKIYNHLRKSYNPYATAGVMGCWEVESRNKPNRVEGDYIKNYWGDANVLRDNESMNAYTTQFLFPAYNRSSVKYKPAGYVHNNNYYPGVGLAQWTGKRGEDLFKYAQSTGGQWGALDTQLGFFDKEMSSSYSGLNSRLANVESVAQGTKEVLDGYEMSKGFSDSHPDHYQKRLNAANAIYNEFGGRGVSRPNTQPAPTIDHTSGRLSGNAGGVTIPRIPHAGSSSNSDIEKALTKIIALLENLGGIVDPIRSISDNTEVLGGIGKTLDAISPRIGSGGNNITNIRQTSMSGHSGYVSGKNKNASLAEQIARGG